MSSKPHIVLIIPRGEAVRNFLYSDTLPVLSENAKVTLLSVIHDDAFRERFGPYVERIVPLEEFPERRVVGFLRHLIWESHFRWLWSEVAKNRWEVWDYRKSRRPGNSLVEGGTTASPVRIGLQKALYTLLANRPALRALTALENEISYALRPTEYFNELFSELKPDLVFNGSHIHGSAGFLPVRVAHKLGIPTAGFIFSWDNLTSRSRIMEPYDYYLVWHQQMRNQFLDIYPEIGEDRVFITGTPQFDFHFNPEYWLSREQLADHIGFDPSRPFILYTTGIDRHFPEEHRTVELVTKLLNEIDVPAKPQLVVRTYVKGTSCQMRHLSTQAIPDVYFPAVQWDAEWYTPAYEDLSIYTSLVREAAVGINAASTVTLELLMHGKPVINLAFDPPGSDIPRPYRWSRHIAFDHFRPVVSSRETQVAHSPTELKSILCSVVTRSADGGGETSQLIQQMFGDTLDGGAGRKVADRLTMLAKGRDQRV